MKKFLSALLAALLIFSFSVTGLIDHTLLPPSDGIIIDNDIETNDPIGLYNDSVDPGLDGDSPS